MSAKIPPPTTPSLLSYKPSAYYFRRRLRGTDDPAQLRKLGLAVVLELEQLKAWVREQGMIPPKWNVLREEAEEKGWPDQG
ncbi:hypothetical protein [Geminisphaera colitermitum]|uniref:hypothetical protein n=1 Tax=Geminisphaera colitermitum TaxID=1148786 RepID=UPI000158CFDF|nr:hypothetical protein [Geminisphaera colitermitum]